MGPIHLQAASIGAGAGALVRRAHHPDFLWTLLCQHLRQLQKLCFCPLFCRHGERSSNSPASLHLFGSQQWADLLHLMSVIAGQCSDLALPRTLSRLTTLEACALLPKAST